MRLTIFRRRLILRRYGVNSWHAGPGGAVLLKGEARWGNLSGLGVNTKWGAFIFEFRRVPGRGRRVQVQS